MTVLNNMDNENHRGRGRVVLIMPTFRAVDVRRQWDIKRYALSITCFMS